MQVNSPHSNNQLSLFPVEPNLLEATNLIKSKLPIVDENELHSLLAIYHNTMLKEINDGQVIQAAQ